MISRTFEFQADGFAVKQGCGSDLRLVRKRDRGSSTTVQRSLPSSKRCVLLPWAQHMPHLCRPQRLSLQQLSGRQIPWLALCGAKLTAGTALSLPLHHHLTH